MNSPFDPTDAVFSLFPPAVSPRGREDAREEATLDHPLGPFSGAPRREDAVATETGAEPAGQELPDYLVEPDFLVESEEVVASDEAVWLEFDEPDELVLDQATSDLVAATPAEEPEAPAAPEAEPDPKPIEAARDDETLIAGPEWEYGYDSFPPAPAQHPVVEEVAARLEGIARALRERSPAELLGGSADPLQLLIAGYVLGLSESSRTSGEAKPERG